MLPFQGAPAVVPSPDPPLQTHGPIPAVPQRSGLRQPLAIDHDREGGGQQGPAVKASAAVSIFTHATYRF